MNTCQMDYITILHVICLDTSFKLYSDMHCYSKDVFSEDRATASVITADISNFLHPVIYYYKEYGNSELYY